MKTKSLLSILFFTGSVAGLSGQSAKLDGEIRTRSEYRDGFQKPLADTLTPSFVSNLRTKINFEFEKENLRAKITLFDTRYYGETGTANTGSTVGFLEAWGEYDITNEFSLKLGRQSLEYDDKRLFSANNWSNTPGAHDLLLLKYSLPVLSANIGAAWNNDGNNLFERSYTEDKSYKSLFYFWLEKNFSSITASAIFVNDNFQEGEPGHLEKSHRYTTGANIRLKDNRFPLSFYLTGYYQFGDDEKSRQLNAYLFAMKLGLTATEKISFHVGSDVFSGSDRNLSSGKNRTFNKLYGTNHAFNGSIEYWSNLPTQGLTDIYGSVFIKPASKFDIDFTFHTFSSTKSLNDNYGKNLGSEIDITTNYRVSKELELQVGWSGYFTTKSTGYLKNQVGVDTRFPQWAYIMITLKPAFL